MLNRERRKRAVLVVMIAGLGVGLVFSLFFGTDSRLAASFGMLLGAAAGLFFQVEYPPWVRVSLSVLTISIVVFV